MWFQKHWWLAIVFDFGIHSFPHAHKKNRIRFINKHGSMAHKYIGKVSTYSNRKQDQSIRDRHWIIIKCTINPNLVALGQFESTTIFKWFSRFYRSQWIASHQIPWFIITFCSQMHSTNKLPAVWCFFFSFVHIDFLVCFSVFIVVDKMRKEIRNHHFFLLLLLIEMVLRLWKIFFFFYYQQ